MLAYERFSKMWLVVPILFLALPVLGAVDEDFIRERFKEAVDALEMGDDEACQRAMNEIMKSKPTTDLALELRDQAGYKFFMRLLAKKPLDVLAREFLALAEKKTRERNTDPKYIRNLIADLSKDFETQWKAKLHIEAEVGQYAVPYLINLVRGDENELSIFSQVVLRGIGEEGVPALLAVLDSGDVELIETVVTVLGQIGDGRAIPYLAAIYDDQDATVEMKNVAELAARKILGRRMKGLSSARELLFDLAERYYYRDPSVMREARASGYILWKWSEAHDGLVWKEAPASVYYDEMAELTCYRCFKTDSGYEPPYSLLAAVYFSQLDTAREVIAAVDTVKDIDIGIIERNMEYLKERKEELDIKAALVTKSLGARHLYRCLDRALRDGNVVVATMAMRMLGEVAEGGFLPPMVSSYGVPLYLPERGNIVGAEGTPILRALASPDKRVKYVAAETLVAINPARPFLHGDRVVPVLAQALGEKAVWFTLIVDADSERANKLKALFPEDDFTVSVLPSPSYAKGRASQFPAPDIILISSDLPQHGAKKLVAQLKQDFRTAGIPIVILASPDTDTIDRKVFKGKVAKIITWEENLFPVMNAIKNEFLESPVESIKAGSEDVALRAAESLAAIDPRSTVLTPLDALRILINSVSDRSDRIKKPCLIALGRLGMPEATPVITSVFENTENDTEVRLLAGEALGFCNPAKAYDALKRALNDPDAGVRSWAATALGKADMGGEYLRKILHEQRIGPILEKVGSSVPGE